MTNKEVNELKELIGELKVSLLQSTAILKDIMSADRLAHAERMSKLEGSLKDFVTHKGLSDKLLRCKTDNHPRGLVSGNTLIRIVQGLGILAAAAAAFYTGGRVL